MANLRRPNTSKDTKGGEEEGDRDARHRLALTRVLIWAEREAASQGRADVSQKLRDVIAALHKEAR